MGFYEDDRIRRKNAAYNGSGEASTEETKSFDLALKNDVSLSEVISTLKDAGFKITLVGTNTIVIRN
jgi:hypothetical protein